MNLTGLLGNVDLELPIYYISHNKINIKHLFIAMSFVFLPV